MFESILAGFLIFFMILGLFSTFYMVDKPRQPIRFGVAVASSIVNVILIVLLWKAYL